MVVICISVWLICSLGSFRSWTIWTWHWTWTIPVQPIFTALDPFNYFGGRSAALEGSALSYLNAHFPDGVTTVLSPTEGSSHYLIQVVANKYNPTNFWLVSPDWYRCFWFCVNINYRSGRWRSEYTVDLTTNQIAGRILINIHYYEQGNVSMAANKAVSSANWWRLGSTIDNTRCIVHYPSRNRFISRHN